MLRIKSDILRRRREMSATQTPADRSRKIFLLISILVLLASVNVIAMMVFEGLSVWDAIWLTMTTVSTVGYGDFSAQTVGGRLATILLMYIVGIFLLAQIAGEWIDLRLDRKERMRKGLWSWKMKKSHPDCEHTRCRW